MSDHQIASPSRDKNGNITTPGARFIGDLESVVEHAASQLLIQANSAGRALTHDAAIVAARAEVEFRNVGATTQETPAKATELQASTSEEVPNAEG